LADINNEQARNIVFSTQEQQDMLANCSTIYVDGIFHVVKNTPFIQLLSIHGFMACEDRVQQEPLCFALMTSRRTADYLEVLPFWLCFLFLFLLPQHDHLKAKFVIIDDLLDLKMYDLTYL
jgi:hypothetical protein